MTAQVPERLLYRGDTLDLAAIPLHDYLLRIAKARRPDFVWRSTACWRGYLGTWKFRDGVLCLVGLCGEVRRGDTVIEADLRAALPWVEGCLPATWLTGLLRCPEGRLLAYSHYGFGSQYERDRLFHVQNGRLMGEFVEVHPPAPLLYRVDADGVRHRVSHVGGEVLDDPLAGRPLADAHLVWGREPAGDAGGGYVVAGCVVRGRPS